MHERLPATRVAKIINTMKRERGGSLRHITYKDRSVGKTEQWEVTKKLFDFHFRRLGFDESKPKAETKVAAAPVQPGLFG